MEEEYKPSTTMVMGAIGMDGLLRDGGSKGITLKSTADVLTVKTTSEEVDGLDSSEGSLSRLRLGVEAVRPFPLANGSSLLPSMELGIRQDGGDAETGFGMDLGAGILWLHRLLLDAPVCSSLPWLRTPWPSVPWMEAVITGWKAWGLG